MDSLLFEKLENFVEHNRKGNVFRGQDVKDELVGYLLNATCIYTEENDEITGILCYEFTEYFPLTITICEILCIKPGTMVELLEQLSQVTPPNFKLLASRKLSTKTVEYKNPRRLLKLIQYLYGKRRWSTTPI
jgi:hypothetical protein